MSETTNESEMFAYGENEYKCSACPAVSAGFNVEQDSLLGPAKIYDEYIRDNFNRDWRGVVNEDVAKEAWIHAIHTLDGRNSLYETEREQARKVAANLGWLDE